MKIWVFFIALTISFLVENVYLSIPLVFDAILFTYILRRDSFIFPIALGVGILFDAISLEEIGIRSLFFLSFLFLVMLYERKFEIQTYPFVFFSSFIGGVVYLFFFNHSMILPQALFNSVLVIAIWKWIQSKFLISH